MTDQLRSGLIGGLIAAVIWMIITVLVEMSKAAIVGGGLALLVGTMLISTAISTIIGNRAGARGH